jgi:hypothetical protein
MLSGYSVLACAQSATWDTTLSNTNLNVKTAGACGPGRSIASEWL